MGGGDGRVGLRGEALRVGRGRLRRWGCAGLRRGGGGEGAAACGDGPPPGAFSSSGALGGGWQASCGGGGIPACAIAVKYSGSRIIPAHLDLRLRIAIGCSTCAAIGFLLYNSPRV